MKTIDKKLVVTVLNSLNVIEREGGEDAYILVENNEENRLALNAVGVSNETIMEYGDEETFCILALAFGERFADLYKEEKFISFDKSIEITTNIPGRKAVFYEHEGETYFLIMEDDGFFNDVALSPKKINEIKLLLNEDIENETPFYEYHCSECNAEYVTKDTGLRYCKSEKCLDKDIPLHGPYLKEIMEK